MPKKRNIKREKGNQKKKKPPYIRALCFLLFILYGRISIGCIWMNTNSYSLEHWANKSSQGKLLSLVWAGTNHNQTMQNMLKTDVTCTHSKHDHLNINLYKLLLENYECIFNQHREPKHKQNGKVANKSETNSDIHSLHYTQTWTHTQIYKTYTVSLHLYSCRGMRPILKASFFVARQCNCFT